MPLHEKIACMIWCTVFSTCFMVVVIVHYVLRIDCIVICRRGLISFLFTLHSRWSSFIASIPEWGWHGMWQLQRLNSQDVSHHFASWASSASVTVPKDSLTWQTGLWAPQQNSYISICAEKMYHTACPRYTNNWSCKMLNSFLKIFKVKSWNVL